MRNIVHDRPKCHAVGVPLAFPLADLTLNDRGETEKVRVWSRRPVMCSHGHVCGGWTGIGDHWKSHVLGQGARKTQATAPRRKGGTKRKAASVHWPQSQLSSTHDSDDEAFDDFG